MNRAKLLERLVEHEDLRLFVYDDATGKPLKKGDTLKGYPTIGIGRELSKTGLTRGEAFMLADNDIIEMTRRLEGLAVWGTLNDTRQRVLANMAFNLGFAGLMKFRNMLRALEDGDYETAAEEMLCSRWAGQVKGRAQRLAKMMRTGEG